MITILDLAASRPVDAVPEGAVFLLGYFDGVHLGHQSLLNRVSEVAHGRPAAVWTFFDLPKTAAPKTAEKHDLLTTLDEKCTLFRRYGADYAVFEDFADLCDLDGETFFRTHLAERWHPAGVICGFNFTFGKDAAWSADDLARFAGKYGAWCRIESPYYGARDGVPVSSTEIRRRIRMGDMPGAAELLGRNYAITAEVIHGNQIGRTIHHPTINQRFPVRKVQPPHGVYSCRVTVEQSGVSKTYDGVCNLGSRPTVNDAADDVTLETELFDFSGDLYGVSVTTAFVEWLRPERKFDDLDALKRQIDADKQSAVISLTAGKGEDDC